MVEQEIPIPKTLDELVKFLHEEMGSQGLENSEVSRVQKLLENYESNAKDWERFAMFDEGRYTRNLVDTGNNYI
jgi:cysteine dioxygenase